MVVVNSIDQYSLHFSASLRNQAVGLPKCFFITPAEKELIDLTRKYGGLTKGKLVPYTDHSRPMITSRIDFFLPQKFIIENQALKIGLSGRVGSPLWNDSLPSEHAWQQWHR